MSNFYGQSPMQAQMGISYSPATGFYMRAEQGFNNKRNLAESVPNHQHPLHQQWVPANMSDSEDESSDEEEYESPIRKNYRKGRLFQEQIADVLDSSLYVESWDDQVVCEYGPYMHKGYADFEVETKLGKEWVIEAKNYDDYPIRKQDVVQVYEYAQCLKAKPLLVVSDTTSMPPSRENRKLAREKGVTIQTFKQFQRVMLH